MELRGLFSEEHQLSVPVRTLCDPLPNHYRNAAKQCRSAFRNANVVIENIRSLKQCRFCSEKQAYREIVSRHYDYFAEFLYHHPCRIFIWIVTVTGTVQLDDIVGPLSPPRRMMLKGSKIPGQSLRWLLHRPCRNRHRQKQLRQSPDRLPLSS